MHTYCINTKTGRVVKTTPQLVKVRDIMVLSDDSPVVALFKAVPEIESFDVIPADNQVGFLFSPRISPALQADDEFMARVRAVDGGQEVTYEDPADLTAIDPVSVGVRTQLADEDGNPVENYQPQRSVRPGAKYTLKDPDKFDFDVDLSTLGKAELQPIAMQIEGFPGHAGMSVAQYRNMLSEVITHIKTHGNGAELAPMKGRPPVPEQTLEARLAKQAERGAGDGPLVPNPLPPAETQAADTAANVEPPVATVTAVPPTESASGEQIPQTPPPPA